ncbi:MAG: peptide-methionine (S)-S-oxide reductase MsrA [Alphaproteobacteria bacterium]|nr:peptide-methionine (S)-S-oxide reductase MsrA [Alphaproteobacteria bacterium]
MTSRLLRATPLLLLASLAAALFYTTRAPAAAPSIPSPALDAHLASAPGKQVIVLAGGCFWGVQAVYLHTKGVTRAVAGYSGGTAATANYELVSGHGTGHAESVEVTYDPSKISVGQILKIFFSVVHNPTEKDRQGPDVGPQYRSVVFFSTPEQERVAKAYIAQLDAAKVYPAPIVTEVVPLKAFYPAEDYHQNYLATHMDQPYIVINDLPKLAALKEQYPSFYRN